jgi:hypothetical protein
VFCREHFAHAQLGVDSSRPLCPYDRTPLEPVIHPNGRGAQRIARASHPARLVRVLREGPLPPDAPYIAAAIEALAPGSLDAEPAIEGRAVTDWSYAESRNDGLQLAYRPPRFEVATTHAVFEGDRICIARVLELRPGSDGDVRFPGDEPSGEPAALETATRDIGRLFAAHVERLRSLSRDDLSLLAAVARCEPLLDARLLGPTARAALRCLQQSERTRQAMSSGALIGARAILVTAIAEADPDRARSWFPVSYRDTLRELLETTLRVPRGFDIAHWIYCRRGNDCTVQLGFSPHDGGVENVAIVVPSDLLSESELRSLDDWPAASAPAVRGTDDAGAPAAALISEIHAALAAIRRARFDGAAGTSDPLRPSGVRVLTFSAAHERRYVLHRRLLLHLVAHGQLSEYRLLQVELAGLDDVAGMLAVIGRSSAMRTFERTTYYAAEAEAFVERECGGDWKQLGSTSSAQDVPIPGCALDLRGAERSFVEILSLLEAHAGKIRILGEH